MHRIAFVLLWAGIALTKGALCLAVVGAHSDVGRELVYYGKGRGWDVCAVAPAQELDDLVDLACPRMLAQDLLRLDADVVVCDATTVRRDAFEVLVGQYGDAVFLVQSASEGVDLLKSYGEDESR